MAEKDKFADEMLTDEELDGVAGGRDFDRGLVAAVINTYYSEYGGSSHDINTIVENFCTKAGIEWQKNENGYDKFKIDGEWRDSNWIVSRAFSNDQELFDYFDKKLGLK